MVPPALLLLCGHALIAAQYAILAPRNKAIAAATIVCVLQLHAAYLLLWGGPCFDAVVWGLRRLVPAAAVLPTPTLAMSVTALQFVLAAPWVAPYFAPPRALALAPRWQRRQWQRAAWKRQRRQQRQQLR